jgi:hypothetical protein
MSASTSERGSGSTVVRWVFLTIAVVLGIGYARHQYAEATKRAEAEKTAAALRTATMIAAPVPRVEVTRQLVQLPDCYTPCSADIAEIRDIYTDGEAIYMLPPGWLHEKAIAYSGKGHITIEGGNIRSGVWKFWAADKGRAD